MERLDCKKDSEIMEKDEHILQLRHWASLRGQTLCRTGDNGFSLSIPTGRIWSINNLTFCTYKLMQLEE